MVVILMVLLSVLRTLTGHKSSIRSLDFHPYGDFVASGSLDTNLKVNIKQRILSFFIFKKNGIQCRVLVNSLRN
jgi:WD40 repeat protein